MRFPFLLGIAFACAFFSCTNKEEKKTGDEKSVFHYNQPNHITSLDPAFAKSQNNIWAIDHLFNSLVELDENLDIQPSIASSWTVSADGKQYTFKLRKDVYFHDNACFQDAKGRGLIAQDVVYSLNRIIDPKVASPGAWIFKNRLKEDKPFEVLDDYTFVLNLKTAFRPILGILAMKYCSIIPREAVTKYGNELRKNPVGTGAFQFKKWLENQNLFLLKNQAYFEEENGNKLPYLDAVKVSFIADRRTAFLEFEKGKLDYISGVESSFINNLLTKEGTLVADKKEKAQFIKSPFLNTEYLGFNLSFGGAKNPLKNKWLRQALNYGVDRAAMLRALKNNIGKAANAGFSPRGLPSHDAKATLGYQYNPEKAANLLAKAGYPKGKGLATITLHTGQDYVDICNFVAKQWEELGINVKIEQVESANLRNSMTRGELAFFRGSWIADYPDAENFYTVFYGKNPAPPNYTRFKNEAFDQLYESALNENDEEKRMGIYHQMDRILIEEAPVVFLYYDETAIFASKAIKGLSKNAINLLSLKKVKK